MSSKSPGQKRKLIVVSVLMLDDTEVPFQLDAKTTGQEFINMVYEYLKLVESDYFSLEFYNSKDQKCWLDYDKSVVKQLLNDLKLVFGVKFYTPDPGQLEEEYTRYLYALQIKRDLADGLLLCSDATACLLVSYILQAEIGDYQEIYNDNPNYFQNKRYFPHQNEEHTPKIIDYHKSHNGQTPADADLNLLDIARKVELYGVVMHAAKDHEGVQLNLAVANMGILVFQNYTKINTFSWAKIRKLSFRRKKFLVKLHSENYGFYKDTVEFYFDNRDDSKAFWKKCIEHHSFFRCLSIMHMPRQKSKLFATRGSSFRYYGRTQKELIENARENFSKNRLFDRSYHSIRSINNLNSIGCNNLIINGTQSLNRNLASRSTGALLTPGSSAINGHGGSSTLSSNDSDQNYNLGNHNTSTSAHHLSYNIPSSTGQNVQVNQSFVDKAALSVRSLDEKLVNDIGDMPYELAKASQSVVQNRKQRHLHDDTSTHGSRTIDSRYSNDKTLGLSDEDDNDEDDDDLDLENNGQFKSDTNNKIEDENVHEHEQGDVNGSRKNNKNGTEEFDERDNSIDNENLSENKERICPCGLNHDDLELEEHSNLMADSIGKLPSYLNKLGSMLEDKDNNSKYIGIDPDTLKQPLQTNQKRIGGVTPTTEKIKLDISVGSANDTELVGNSQQSNPNKIYSRKEVITTSYCKEEIKNTHHEEYSTYYDTNNIKGQSPTGNNSSSLLLTTVEKSVPKHRANSNIIQKHQQKRYNISNPDSYAQSELPENDDEGKNLANKIKKNSSSLNKNSGSISNNNENDNSSKRLKKKILNPPNHQHKSKSCSLNEDFESIACASQNGAKLSLDDNPNLVCVETKPDRHRHKHSKSKDKNKEKERKRGKTKEKTKTSRSSSNFHQNSKNDHDHVYHHSCFGDGSSLHHSTMKTDDYVSTRSQKVPYKNLTITPVFQTSTLGNYCNRHQRYHHNQNKLTQHHYNLEEKKNLKQSSNKSQMHRESFDFMSIKSEIGEMDKKKNNNDDIHQTHQQSNDKNATRSMKEFSFSPSTTTGSNSFYLKEEVSLFPIPSLSSTSSSSEDLNFLDKALSPTSSIALSSIYCSDSSDSLKASMLELNKMSVDLNKKIIRTIAKTSKRYCDNSLEKQTKCHSQQQKHQKRKENSLFLISPGKNKKINMSDLSNLQDLKKEKESGNIEVLVTKPKPSRKKQRKNRHELGKNKPIASSDRKFKSLPRVLNSGKQSHYHSSNEVDVSGLSVEALSYCVDCSSLVSEEIQHRDKSLPCERHDFRLVVDKFDMNSTSKMIINGSCPMLRSSDTISNCRRKTVQNILTEERVKENSDKSYNELLEKAENACENELKGKVDQLDDGYEKEEQNNHERIPSRMFENNQLIDIDINQSQNQCENDEQPIRKILEKIVESKLQSIAALVTPVEKVDQVIKDNEAINILIEEEEDEVLKEIGNDGVTAANTKQEEKNKRTHSLRNDIDDQIVLFEHKIASGESEVESDGSVTSVVDDALEKKNNCSDDIIGVTNINHSDGLKISQKREENTLEVDSLMNIEESDSGNYLLEFEDKKELKNQRQSENEDEILENDETSIKSEILEKLTFDEENSENKSEETIVVEKDGHLFDNIESICDEDYCTLDRNEKACSENDFCFSSKDDNSQDDNPPTNNFEETSVGNKTLPEIMSMETETNIINRTVYKVLEKAQEIVATEYKLYQPKLTDQNCSQN